MALKLTHFGSDLTGEELTHFADTDLVVDGIRYRPIPGDCRRLMFETLPDDGHMSRAHAFLSRPIDEEAWLVAGEIRDAAAETDTVLFL